MERLLAAIMLFGALLPGKDTPALETRFFFLLNNLIKSSF
jgi:hypothetical protein